MSKFDIKNNIGKLLKVNLIRNLLIVLTGDGLVAILSIINFSLIVKAIGLDGNGILIMVQSYCLLFDTLMNFQSFTALIKFLPIAFRNNDKKLAANYISQAIKLDIITAFLAFLLANILASFIASFMDWDYQMVKYIHIYSFVILFNVTGAAIGVIRFFNKFKYTSIINVMVALTKFIMYIVGFYKGYDIRFFLFTELILAIINNIAIVIMGYRILIENRMTKLINIRQKMDKEFFKFNIHSNLTTALDVPVTNLTAFFISKFLGFADITVYKFIEKLGSIVARVGAPLYNVLYPEISVKVAEGKYLEAKKLVRKIFNLMFTAGLVLITVIILTHSLWLELVLEGGSAYIIVIAFYLFYVILRYAVVGVYPLFISCGYIKYNAPIIFVVNLCYLFLIYILIQKYSLIGIISSQLLQVIIVNILYINIMKIKNKVKFKEGIS